MYVKKTYVIKDWVLTKKYHSGRYGAPGVTRAERKAPTSEAVRKVNQKHREENVQRLILANFDDQDLHVTVTYKPETRPGSMEEAKKDRSTLLDRLRREYRKLGQELKYIGGTEKGRRGAYHHHILINRINVDGITTDDLLQRIWRKGHYSLVRLYTDDDYRGLADYLVKKETKEEAEGGWSYTRSRNLIVPQPKIEIIHARKWAKDPKPPKGYEIVRNSLRNTTNPFTGYPVQEYMMRKIRPKPRGGS